ncbi:MAG: GNAT family N-acetyltransferase [Gemmatimonadota bacterium]|nr:GNAT family N-acetyltransferase [Gemmatimonadota bacterium]
MPLEIRPATPADASQIAPLLGELGYPSEEREIRARLERFPGHNVIAVVAELDGRIVGVATLAFFASLTFDADVAWITAFVVSSTLRGSGIGRDMLARLELIACERGCERIAVTSAERRDGAHAFYQRLGYAYTGRRFVKQLNESVQVKHRI